jgi:hypothetical protein
VSAGQFSRRTFLKTTGAVTAGAIVATGLPAPVRAAPADSADAVGFSSDGNPFVTNIYTADPDAFVFNGPLYVDTDRDQAPLGANDFVMTDWHLYSTTDTVNWTDHGVLLSLADFPWANRKVNDLHDDGDLTDAQAAELVASAALIGSTIQQSIS